MSDPVSNAEIEDVLSSIRRLVSEEPSPLLRRKKIAEGAKERFVLTPALRVSDEDTTEIESDRVPEASLPSEEIFGADVFEQPADDDRSKSRLTRQAESDDKVLSLNPQARDQEPSSPDRDRLATHRQTLEQRIAELETALQQAPDEWEPDGSEVDAAKSTHMPAFEASPDAAEAGPAPSAEDLSDGPKAGQPEAEEGATEEQATDWFDESVGEDLHEMAAGPDLHAVSEVNHEDTLETEATPEVETIELAEEPQPRQPDTVDLSAFDSALDGPDSDAEAWHDADEADPAAEKPFIDEDADEAGGNLMGEDAVLDEAALQDMVSQLVREELQGVLGERITRNVRRLVRREIQRALAVRDLE